MPRDPELYPDDLQYYQDPYGPLDNTDDWSDEELEYLGEIYYEDDDKDLTEAQYADRSWDEYSDGVFSEDLEDD